MRWQPDSAPFRALLAALAREISPVYVVGGAVRDVLMQRARTLSDLDLVVSHSAIPIARRVADRLGWAFYPLDEGRDVARIIFGAGPQPLVCDIARMRGGSIEADLRARDFTVNALAFAYAGGSDVEIVDPGSGRADLAARLLRRVSASSLADDPARILRAVRFSVELGFPLEDETRLQILRMPGSLQLVSPERQRDELWKMLASANPAAAVDMLRTLGLLPFTLPEVAATDLVTQSPPHDKDVFRHTLAAVQFAAALRDWLLGRRPQVPLPAFAAEPLLAAWQTLDTWGFYLRQHFAPTVAAGRTRAEWLVWAALFHDVGKPATRTLDFGADPGADPGAEPGPRIRFFNHERIGASLTLSRLTALRFSRPEIELCSAEVLSHMRPHHLHDAFAGSEISRRARYRFFRDVGTQMVDRPVGVDVLFLALADYLAIDDTRPLAEWRRYLHHCAEMLAFVFSERAMETAALRPLIDGHTLINEFALAPGPQIGELLDQIAEARAAGEVSTPADALALARTLVRKRIL